MSYKIVRRWVRWRARPCSLSGDQLDGNSIVRIIYVDESGISAKESVLVVAGVIINADKQWISIAKSIGEIVAEFVPPDRQLNFTFHAKDLFHGTGRTLFDRRKFPIARSHDALKRFLRIPSMFHLPIVYGYVNKSKTVADQTLKQSEKVGLDHAIAFSMCIAAAEAFMKEQTAKEVATVHAENNTDTQKMLRVARLLIIGRANHSVIPFMGDAAQKYLPLTKIVDEVSFIEKRDAPLLQLADVCALFLRYAFERKENCESFFDVFTIIDARSYRK